MSTDVFTDLSGSLYVLIQPDHKNHLSYLLKLMQTPGAYLSWTPGMSVFPRARLSGEGNVWENAEARPWPQGANRGRPSPLDPEVGSLPRS